jgi:putative tRNA adenosine deaminase-associated protein
LSYFAAVLTRHGNRWSGDEADLAECESLDDLADILRDLPGDVRLLLIEEDDEYAAIVRMDERDVDARAFLSDGHSADRYPMAALVAENLTEVGAAGVDDGDVDGEVVSDGLVTDVDVPLTHDSAPFGDVDVVDDLGTSASDLVAMCEHPGTLPVDLLLAVCEKAGCGDVFEDLRG